MNVRTRFAPSPTGSLHIGNVRTALYAWLFARNQGGKFILRIEDTSLDNDVSDASIENIITVMKWLKLDWDEGPYFQSRRLHRYRSVIDNMLKHQLAYKCYCSKDRLETLRLNQIKHKEKPKYDGYCRTHFIVSQNHMFDRTIPYVIRFFNPKDGKITFSDQIRGTITFNNQELDDLIICRSNGIPTYNFCVVVDDIDMNITHIIRGEEHINNTPRQINIMRALKATIPVYAHVPMVLDSKKTKLSKRYRTSGIMKYDDDGFLPEAILNYLIRLGWSYGNQEIFSIEEMKNYFCLNKISKSSSVFNFQKLLWLNRYYINHLPTSDIVDYLQKYMNTHGLNCSDKLKLVNIVSLFSKNCSTLKEMMCHYSNLYENFDIFEKKIAKQYLTSIMMDPLKILRNRLHGLHYWTIEAIRDTMREVMTQFNIDMHSMGMVVRVVLTGTNVSPHINTVIYILGKECVLNRISQSINYIKNVN